MIERDENMLNSQAATKLALTVGLWVKRDRYSTDSNAFRGMANPPRHGHGRLPASTTV